MKLEANDRKNPDLVGVATISDIKGDQLRIHFDGWSNRYDYWCGEDTTDIHPIGWCRDHSCALQKPRGMKLMTLSIFIDTSFVSKVLKFLFPLANYTNKYRVNGTPLYKLDNACRSPQRDCCLMGNPSKPRHYGFDKD